MANNFYGAVGLTGGTDGQLDYFDGDSLADKDGAVVITAAGTYSYILDDDSAAAESPPDVIAPDNNAGTKRWILTEINLADLNALGAVSSDGEMIVATGSGAFAYESGATLRTSIGVGTGNVLTIAGVIIANGGTVGQAAGPLLTFNDTDNILAISGCDIGIGTASVALNNVGVTLQLASKFILQSISGQVMVSHNAHFGASNQWRYYTTDTASAIRIDGSGDGAIKFHLAASGTAGNVISGWDTTDVRMIITQSAVTAATFNATDEFKVDNVQVVSNRVIDARCDDAINSGDATTDGVIDALRDAMITHGLIAAA